MGESIKKLEMMFGKSYYTVDVVLILLLLALYKWKQRSHFPENIYLGTSLPSDFDKSNYETKTVSVYAELFDYLRTDTYAQLDNSMLFQCVLTDFLREPVTFYTDNISPLYTIVGSKNCTMQTATADALATMNLDTQNMVLVDGCCATGSLVIGLKTYDWNKVILNNLNPLITIL